MATVDKVQGLSFQQTDWRLRTVTSLADELVAEADDFLQVLVDGVIGVVQQIAPEFAHRAGGQQFVMRILPAPLGREPPP